MSKAFASFVVEIGGEKGIKDYDSVAQPVFQV